MIAPLLLPLSLCALAASVSGHLMNADRTRWTDLSTSVAWLPSTSTGPLSLHRRALSIDLNEAPPHHFDLNEMPDSDGEPGHHAEEAALHTGGQASPRQPQRHLSRPVTPFSAREPIGEPSSTWMAWGRRKRRTSGGFLSSTTATPKHRNGDAGSSSHAEAKQADERRRELTAYYNERRKKKKRLLGYKLKENFRDEDRGKRLEEVVASLNNEQYTPISGPRPKREIRARFMEKKRLLGYRSRERLQDEHKIRGFNLEEIRRRQGLDPFAPVRMPSARPRKRIKRTEEQGGNELASHSENVEDHALGQAATKDSQRKAWNDIAASILAGPGKQTRGSSFQR